MDESRKCFRLIGGVLCEGTVKTILPQLVSNKDKLEELIKTGNEQINKKGEEILKYKEEHNIRIAGQGGPEGAGGGGAAAAEEKAADPNTNRNVLVVNH